MPQGAYRLTDAQPLGGFALADVQADAPYQPRNILEEGRRSVAAGARDDTPDDQAPWEERNKAPLAAWFETQLRPLLERVAHPQTINDLAALLVPEGGALAQGARATAADVDRVTANLSRAIGKLPTPTGQQVLTVLKTVRHPVREGLKAVADQLIARLEPAVAAQAPVVGRVVGKAPTVDASIEAALQELRQAPAAAEVPRLPEYPQAATDTMRQLEARPPLRARVQSAPVAPPPQLGTPVGPVAAPPTAAPIAPVASHVRDVNAVRPAAASAPPAAPVRAAAGPFNPSAALGDARQQFAAIGETPRPAEVTNAMEYIRRGESAEDAVAHVIRLRPSSVRAAPVPAAAAVAAAKPSWTAEEVAFGQRLMARGKTEAQAIDAILAQRALLQIPGTQSSAAVRAAQDLRNAQGATKTPSAATAATRRR